MRERELAPRRRDRRLSWGFAVPLAAALAVPFFLWPEAERAASVDETVVASPRVVRADGPPRTLPVFTRLNPTLPGSATPPPAALPATDRELSAGLAAPDPLTSPARARALPEQALEAGLDLTRVTRPAGGPALSDKELEEFRQRARPGHLGANVGPLVLHTDVRALPLTPDVEVAVSERTKLGIFGQVGPAGDRGVVLPHIVNRPVGAGVTLEYRFGTQ